MHLASDYIHPYKDAGGRPSHCRVRIYLPDDVLDAPVVVCSELPNNPGGSITNSAETLERFPALYCLTSLRPFARISSSSSSNESMNFATPSFSSVSVTSL